MLCLYYKIFTFSDHLYSILQSKTLSNPAICFQEIEETIKNINNLRNDQTIESCLTEASELLHANISETIRLNFKRVSFEILDTTVSQMRERFADFEALSFIKLLNKNQYSDYIKKFPRQLLKKLDTSYQNIFNLGKLENELIVIYSCNVKNKLEPLQLFTYINDNGLSDVFSETYRLLKILFTIPITTASSERSMSTLKRIKTYLRNSMHNQRLSALSTISIERDIIKNYADFKDRVIDHFANARDGRIDLIYKKV